MSTYFSATTPPGIFEGVDIRGPKVEAGMASIAERPSLGGHGICHIEDQIIVECSRHEDRAGE